MEQIIQPVSIWSDGKTVPENHVFPTGKGTGDYAVPNSKSVPVIDLSQAEGLTRANVIHQIIEASQEYGFFQVINHGVKKTSMDDARHVFKEFFEQEDAEEQIKLSTLDSSNKLVFYISNRVYEENRRNNWRNTLTLQCTDLEECIQSLPEKPTRFREATRDYTIEVKGLGSRILELISEGLGLGTEYFAKELSQGQLLAVNHYPPCPDASLSMGTRNHCDSQLLTVLLQGDVPGLQVLKDGEWLGVEPIPDAFVINIGHQLQLISNGKLLSVEHRAVANGQKSRISAAFFIAPALDCVVEPAKGLINAENPAIYRGVRFEDFSKMFMSAFVGKTDKVLEHYKI